MVKPRIPEGGAITDNRDHTAEQYSETMKGCLGREYRGFVNHIVKAIKLAQGSTVLEVGPGPGWIGIWLAKERPDIRVTGIEPSPDMRRVATANASTEGVMDRVTYIEGYVENMSSFPDASFDLVISNDSLHHWQEPLKAFFEVSRVLGSDGRVYITDGRRDLGLRAKFILHVPGRLIAGKMWRYWKSSIQASYTPEEVRDFTSQVPRCDWIVKSHFMGLSVETAEG